VPPVDSNENSKKVDEIIKGLEIQRASFRYKIDNLSIVQNINEYIFGINPLKYINDSNKGKEVYDEYVQCKLDEENQNNSEEDEKPHIRERGHRKSAVFIKGKNVCNLSQKKNLEDDKSKNDENSTNLNSNFSTVVTTKNEQKKIIFNDDIKKQLLQSHELNEFLVRNSKYIERVI